MAPVYVATWAMLLSVMRQRQSLLWILAYVACTAAVLIPAEVRCVPSPSPLLSSGLVTPWAMKDGRMRPCVPQILTPTSLAPMTVAGTALLYPAVYVLAHPSPSAAEVGPCAGRSVV